MELSIIIVSYKVRYFLEYCLHSVLAACNGIEAEIIVVDNHSQDETDTMMQNQFAQVKYIALKDNVGFAKANNIGVKASTGKYILYLNPDTIVPEDCFALCLDYIKQNKGVGALGCRLIDGSGNFLPESKRGFPSAGVAFFKITGLSALFKKSKIFNRYHLGFLPENEIAQVDVLAGCFMLCSREAIDKTGGFDEDYFMYGEDIDLSYKLTQAGYQNVYFPLTTIIHFKGESTKKGSLNYVKMFYNAMLIFARKHLSSRKRALYIFLIRLAIYAKAFLHFLGKMVSKIKLPLIDTIIMCIALLFVKYLWIQNVKTETQYAHTILFAFFAFYISVCLFTLYISGTYDKPFKQNKLIRGMLWGIAIVLIVYGLLPEQIRFSRGITLLGGLWGMALLLLLRKCFQWLHIRGMEGSEEEKNIIVVGNAQDTQHIKYLMQQSGVYGNIIGSVSATAQKTEDQLGIFNHLTPTCIMYHINEIVYTQSTLSFKDIINSIQEKRKHIEYKIYTPGSNCIIGSSDKNISGELYIAREYFAIETPKGKRNKRLVDIACSLLLLFVSPLLIFSVKNKKQFIPNLLYILEGDKTFVGYQHPQFPVVKPFLLTTYPLIPHFEIPQDNKEHLDWLYAKNYNAWVDLKIIWEKWHLL